MRRTIRSLALLALLCLIPAVARAQCTATAAPVGFGVYQPFSATPTDSTGSVTVQCTRYGGNYTVALNAGSGGSFANRQMKSGGNSLGYQLYTTTARTTVWGDGSSGTATVAGHCSHTCNNTHTVYGRIPARQAAHPGTYTDTITATVTY